MRRAWPIFISIWSMAILTWISYQVFISPDIINVEVLAAYTAALGLPSIIKKMVHRDHHTHGDCSAGNKRNTKDAL